MYSSVMVGLLQLYDHDASKNHGNVIIWPIRWKEPIQISYSFANRALKTAFRKKVFYRQE